jgi:hypothetical protein
VLSIANDLVSYTESPTAASGVAQVVFGGMSVAHPQSEIEPVIGFSSGLTSPAVAVDTGVFASDAFDLTGDSVPDPGYL